MANVFLKEGMVMKTKQKLKRASQRMSVSVSELLKIYTQEFLKHNKFDIWNDKEEWVELIDFTKLSKKGIKAEDLLKRL